MFLQQNILGQCPGGWCDFLVQFSEVLVVLLLADGFIFLVTLIPPLFSWKNKKPDSRKRIFFAAFACLTFYFWLAVLAIHSLYCFGFLAHAGPCNGSAQIGSPSSARASQLTSDPVLDSPVKTNLGGKDNDSLDSRMLPPDNLVDGEENLVPNMTNMSYAMSEALSQDNSMEKCINNTENSLKNITLVNFLIIFILIIVVAANVNEVLHAKALYYQETLCRKEDIQRFLSSLVTKRPEVGHLVKCFHTSKSADAKTNSGHKVVTYSTVDNFDYQTWKDFSDLRLIEPSRDYPVIEVEIVLNFFPGDQSTAEKYKQFVQKLTKEHSGKDTKISIDDYFHIEDQKEWTFYIGNKQHISPWWEKDPARIFLSCVLLFGWPFRLSYKGKVAKHRIEVKKAVFCETTSQDEGVSLTATPGSSMDGCNNSTTQQEDDYTTSCAPPLSPPPSEPPALLHNNHNSSTASQEHVVDVQVASPPHVSNPPISYNVDKQYQQQERSPDRSTPLLNRHQGNHPLRSAPIASPRTHLRETTKDIVTAVTHHDINGMNAVSTVALKDVDVQMSALSGYETYV
jgi:hypothetical protein